MYVCIYIVYRAGLINILYCSIGTMQWGIRMWCGGQTLKYIYDYIIIQYMIIFLYSIWLYYYTVYDYIIIQYMIILLQTIIPDHAGPPRTAFII